MSLLTVKQVERLDRLDDHPIVGMKDGSPVVADKDGRLLLVQPNGHLAPTLTCIQGHQSYLHVPKG